MAGLSSLPVFLIISMGAIEFVYLEDAKNKLFGFMDVIGGLLCFLSWFYFADFMISISHYVIQNLYREFLYNGKLLYFERVKILTYSMIFSLIIFYLHFFIMDISSSLKLILGIIVVFSICLLLISKTFLEYLIIRIEQNANSSAALPLS